MTTMTSQPPAARSFLFEDVSWDYYDHTLRELEASGRQDRTEVAGTGLRWPLSTARSRRYRLKRFPYAVVYQVVREQVHLLAVAHLKRRPGYWRKRETSP